jgi:hypothetical protein
LPWAKGSSPGTIGHEVESPSALPRVHPGAQASSAVATKTEAVPDGRTRDDGSIALRTPVALPVARIASQPEVSSPRKGAAGVTDSGDICSTLVERCREHIGALYVLAYLYSGDRHVAEEAVADAVASLLAHPVPADGGPVRMWDLLASDIQGQNDRGVFRGTPVTTLQAVAASDVQRQCIALVAVGRTPHDAAVLLDTTVDRLHHNLRGGLRAFRVALRLAHKTAEPY